MYLQAFPPWRSAPNWDSLAFGCTRKRYRQRPQTAFWCDLPHQWGGRLPLYPTTVTTEQRDSVQTDLPALPLITSRSHSKRDDGSFYSCVLMEPVQGDGWKQQRCSPRGCACLRFNRRGKTHDIRKAGLQSSQNITAPKAPRWRALCPSCFLLPATSQKQ